MKSCFPTAPQRYEGSEFKMTELGPIPSDWEVKRLGEIGEPLMCKRILKSQTLDSGDVPFYKIGTFGGAADAYISQSLYESYRRKYSYPKKGDVLLSAAGTIGRAVVYDGRDAYFQDSNIVWLDNDESLVLNEYLYWWYKVISWKTEDGGIVTRLYNNNLKLSLIALPPLPEQRRIAAALSDMDELIGALGKLVEKKRAIKTGAMQRLLTGQTRLPGFGGAEFKQTELGPIPSDWEVKRLGEIGEFSTSTVPASSIDATWYVGTETMLANMKGIVPNEASVPYQSVREYREGDILISNIRPYLKKIWLADRNGGCSTDVLVIRVVDGNSCIPAFLKMLLSNDAFFDFAMANAIGTKMPRGDKKVLINYEWALPPLPEQRAIAAVLSDMDAAIAALEAEKHKVEAIKQGMMQELLTGRVRLEA